MILYSLTAALADTCSTAMDLLKAENRVGRFVLIADDPAFHNEREETGGEGPWQSVPSAGLPEGEDSAGDCDRRL